MTTSSQITFYYDVVCPYAYLASRRIEALAQRVGATIRWCPILLGGVYKSIQSAQVPAQTWAPQKVTIGNADLVRNAEYHNVTLNRPKDHPRRTVNAMRLLTATTGDLRVKLTHALYRAYWVEGRDLSSRTVLDEIAVKHGISPAVIDSTQARDGLFAATAEAVDKGVFGVPAFLVDDQLWWGQDRMHFVEAACGGAVDQSHPTHDPIGSIQFFHDFSSPYSYLGSTQIDRVCGRHGCDVEYKPILLGGLFRTIGTPDVPFLTMSEAKRQYIIKDMNDWAKWWGVAFQFPSQFPVRTILPLRASIVEPKATHPLYTALWAQDRNISIPEVVAEVLQEAGLDAEGIIEGTQDPAVKAVLRTNTEEAAEIGCCGVPTFHINNQLIWGQDRIHLIEAMVSGAWRRN